MNPPRVYELTIPSNQRMTSTTISVSSIAMTSTAEFAGHRVADFAGPRVIEEHHPYQQMLSGSGHASVFARALNLHQLGLVDAGSGDALLPSRAGAPREWWNLHHFPCLRRLIESLDDAHVLQSFFAGWFGLAILHDAVGEVHELRRELIALADAPPRGLAIDGQFVGCLLYTSDAADERSSVDLGGRRIIKK